jgi:putative tryptophan/tyrosine transport system substrate-binding protein
MAAGMTRHGRLRPWLAVSLLAVCVLVVGRFPVAAQSPPYRVAVLTASSAFNKTIEGLREGLAQLGYHEGKNLSLLIEDAQGEVSHLASRAASIVAAEPDLIVAITTVATAAAQRATTTLPIVFTVVSDPLASGFVASHASSKNNLTGIANHTISLSNKRLALLQEIDAKIKRVLVLVSTHERVAQMSFQSLADVAPKLGFELVRRDVTTRAEIAQVLDTQPQGSIDAIFQPPSSLLSTHIDLLIQKAQEDRLSLSVAGPSLVKKGALLSYGPDLRQLGMQAAKLVDQLLHGVKPAEIPIQTPEKLFLTLNLATARSIGLKLPISVLERADHLFE